jgi:hypothetical protein
LSLAPQARKLIEQHGRLLDEAAAEAVRRISTVGSVLTAAGRLLNLRERYFAVTGEHFSLHEYDGIHVIDTLDERLLQRIRGMLQGYVSRARRKPLPEVQAMLAGKLAPGAREMPQYPVGYMVHYMLVAAFQAFGQLLDDGVRFETADLEIAMVHHLLGILDRYAQTREKPVMRHFSDVAREYTVVMRLKCGCGAEKYEVKLQALCQHHGRDPYDRLDLQCGRCGAQRWVTFDLPHFKDMYQI